jgi:glycosyltransferase involved in cell wall biosynthesis
MLKTVFVHDNFIQVGGGERAGEEIARCLPDVDMFSSVVVRERLTPYIRDRRVKTTWMQSLPGMKRLYRHYFLFYPFAMRHAKVTQYDRIISSCYGMAKMVRKSPGALHICYCHSPTRWIWRFEDYLEQEDIGAIRKRILKTLVGWLKPMDHAAAQDVDYFIANSQVVRDRIRACYGKDAIVLHPPIRIDRFTPSEEVGEYYLVVSRLASYKRIQLAIEACERLGRPLHIVGQGPDRERLERMAGPNTVFLGRLPDSEVARLMSQCRALIFPGEEDFGLTPLEVSAAGRPCIAFGQGGALETVKPGLNGLHFQEPSAESLMDAIKQSETVAWDPEAIREHARRFDASHFEERFCALISQLTESYLHRRDMESASLLTEPAQLSSSL